MSLARGTDLKTKSPSGPDGDAPRNARTCIAVVEGAFGRQAPAPREAFEASYDLAAAAASCAAADSVVVTVVDRSRAIVGLVCVDPGQAVTIGRHSECAIWLREQDVSLRHLTIHHGRDGDRPVLRAWDLETGHPFRTEDGELAAAVTAEGPLLATLGGYAIVCLPCDAIDWESGAAAAWDALPERTITGRLAEGTAVREPSRAAPRRRGAAGSLITRTRSAVTLVSAGVSATAVAELVIDSPGGRRRFHLSAEQLERGVLIGRYDRCAPGAIDDTAVSRVHLLIAATASGVHAIDTASTNGAHTTTGAFLSRLLEDEATLRLASSTYLRWRRRIAAQA